MELQIRLTFLPSLLVPQEVVGTTFESLVAPDHDRRIWLIEPQAVHTDPSGAEAGASCCMQITWGNINNNHIYLAKAMHLFPPDVLGGSNKTNAAPRLLFVYWGDEKVETDIDSTKRIFRRRGWIGRFFKANQIVAGDSVLLERLGPYRFRVSRATEL